MAWLCVKICYHIIMLALIRLTDGNTAADGYLEIFLQGEWYSMCLRYGDYRGNNNNAAVVCRELGYEGTVTTSRRYRDYRHEHLLWYVLYCYGNEDSVFSCDKCCDDFYERSSNCLYIPEFACQSKSGLCCVLIDTQLNITYVQMYVCFSF